MTLLIVSAMLVIPSTTSQPAGIEGIGSGGCNCHGASPDSRVSVALEGVPESYNYSETYITNRMVTPNINNKRVDNKIRVEDSGLYFKFDINDYDEDDFTEDYQNYQAAQD